MLEGVDLSFCVETFPKEKERKKENYGLRWGNGAREWRRVDSKSKKENGDYMTGYVPSPPGIEDLLYLDTQQKGKLLTMTRVPRHPYTKHGLQPVERPACRDGSFAPIPSRTRRRGCEKPGVMIGVMVAVNQFACLTLAKFM